MYAELHECLLNLRHRVCGYRLRPLCYDHLEALHAMDHPLPFRASEVTSAQLLTALRICSLTGDRLERDMPSSSPSLRDLWHIAKHAARPATLKRDLRKFEAYLVDHASAPRLAAEMTSGGMSAVSMASVPQLFARMTAVLIAYKGAISERRARSMPIGLLLHYLELARHHNNCGTPFYDPEQDAKIDEQLARADAAGAELLKRFGLTKE